MAVSRGEERRGEVEAWKGVKAAGVVSVAVAAPDWLAAILVKERVKFCGYAPEEE